MDFESVIKKDGVTVSTLIPMSDFSQEKIPNFSPLLRKYKAEFKVIDKHAPDIILFTSGMQRWLI